MPRSRPCARRASRRRRFLRGRRGRRGGSHFPFGHARRVRCPARTSARRHGPRSKFETPWRGDRSISRAGSPTADRLSGLPRAGKSAPKTRSGLAPGTGDGDAAARARRVRRPRGGYAARSTREKPRGSRRRRPLGFSRGQRRIFRVDAARGGPVLMSPRKRLSRLHAALRRAPAWRAAQAPGQAEASTMPRAGGARPLGRSGPLTRRCRLAKEIPRHSAHLRRVRRRCAAVGGLATFTVRHSGRRRTRAWSESSVREKRGLEASSGARGGQLAFVPVLRRVVLRRTAVSWRA